MDNKQLLGSYRNRGFNYEAPFTPLSMANMQGGTQMSALPRQSMQLPNQFAMSEFDEQDFLVLDNTNMDSMVQLNGRKIFGPPENWVGPTPDSGCEIYVRRIPKNLNALLLVRIFERFGKLYEVRLPLDYQQLNRGYAYVKYTNEQDAGAALDVMAHFFVAPGIKFDIQRSYEKCRLCVSNIPCYIDQQEIMQKLRHVFPSMQRAYFQNAKDNSQIGNMYFTNVSGGCKKKTSAAADQSEAVIVEFASHLMALDAKKNTNPGVIRLWERDVYISWAKTDTDTDISNPNKTLFMRNVDLTVNPRDISELLLQYVHRSEIVKVTRVRESAFIDFTTRKAAECVMLKLQATMFRNRLLEIEWAKPSDHLSLHRLRDLDFDAVLRLKCIANNWGIPIILFGTYYDSLGVQYAVTILRNNKGENRAIFCILQPYELVDIQARICEAVCVLIETIGTYPDCNYVFFVHRDTAHLLGVVIHTRTGVIFSASHDVSPEFFIDLNEITDLSYAVAVLTTKNEQDLLAAYQQSLRSHSVSNYLEGYNLVNRKLGCVTPKYRNKPALRFNLNDSQIVLVLCYTDTGSNTMLKKRPHLNLSAAVFDSGYECFRYMAVKLLPIALSQSRLGIDHVISQLIYDNNHSYIHPKQRAMLPTIWLYLCAYSVCIKQPSSNHFQRLHT